MTKKNGSFRIDSEEIKRKARAQLSHGAVTMSYGSDIKTVIRLFNEALATELVCSLRYRRHYYMAQGIHSEAVQEEFLEHAQQEDEHAGWLAERIVQLGGEPDFNPLTLLERSHADYVECDDLVEMIQENLVAERTAIDTYRAMINYIGAGDSTSRRILERILEQEEEHAEDMVSLLQSIDGAGRLKQLARTA